MLFKIDKKKSNLLASRSRLVSVTGAGDGMPLAVESTEVA